MTEVRYYHLERMPVEQALPKLLEKCLERDWRAVVQARSADRVERLNEALWTYDDRSFLPHGAAADGHAAEQPVWLTDADENPNGATVLFLTDGAESAAIDGFATVCRLFDGRDDAAVRAAREAWKAEREKGLKLTYWRQGPRGWEKQAEHDPAGSDPAGSDPAGSDPAGSDQAGSDQQGTQ